MIHRTVLAGLLCVSLGLGACRQDPQPEPVANEQVEEVMGLDRSQAGSPLPDLELDNGEGESAILSEETGEPLLINLWATWCAPCVKELPTLEALGSRDGAPRVIAVSQDMAPRGSVDAFLDSQKLQSLEVWHDRYMALSGKLKAQILPTTILYDAKGREVWRYVGDLDWTGEEAKALLAEVSREEAR